jgi:hypothetical protein
VGELLATIDPDELDEWWALESIQPIPDSYLQMGILTATTANHSMRAPKKWLQASDIYPHLKQGPKRQSQKQMTLIMDAMAAK